MPTKKPNILILWGDDIGMWNVSTYSKGMMGYQTKNIDRIADEADPLAAPVLRGEPFEQRVRVLGVAHLERSELLVAADAVEYHDAACPPHGDEAGKRVRELADVSVELAAVQDVVAVEQIESWLRHEPGRRHAVGRSRTRGGQQRR